jgi:hypothetical protein
MPAEVPLENAQEEIEHQAHSATEKWIMGVALTASILAALAAITALLAEHHANEAIILQVQATKIQVHAGNRWEHFSAESVKEKVVDAKIALLAAVGKTPNKTDFDKLGKYPAEKKKIEEEATRLEEEVTELQNESEQHLKRHGPLSRGLTMFQLAIAVSAISVLTRRKAFWLVAIAFGAVGLAFLAWGIV